MNPDTMESRFATLAQSVLDLGARVTRLERTDDERGQGDNGGSRLMLAVITAAGGVLVAAIGAAGVILSKGGM